MKHARILEIPAGLKNMTKDPIKERSRSSTSETIQT